MNLTEGEIAYLNEMRAITTDSSGNTVFVGLTLQESNEYHRLSLSRGGSSYEEGERYIALNDRHEIARLQVLAAESTLRNTTPTIQ